jgi:hypothetical protein
MQNGHFYLDHEQRDRYREYSVAEKDHPLQLELFPVLVKDHGVGGTWQLELGN